MVKPKQSHHASIYPSLTNYFTWGHSRLRFIPFIPFFKDILIHSEQKEWRHGRSDTALRNNSWQIGHCKVDCSISCIFRLSDGVCLGNGEEVQMNSFPSCGNCRSAESTLSICFLSTILIVIVIDDILNSVLIRCSVALNILLNRNN